MSANTYYNGNIQRGTIMRHSVIDMLGVITEVNNITSNPAGGSDAYLKGTATIVFPNGEIAHNYQEQHLRKFNEIVDVTPDTIKEIEESGISIDVTTMLAEDTAIISLETKATKLKIEREDAEKKEIQAFNEEIEAIKVNGDYNHLEHMEIGKMHWAKDVAKNIRKDLKKHFPKGKFSVKSTELQVISVTIKDDETDKKPVIELLKKYWGKHQTPFKSVYGSLELVNVNGS